MIKINTNALSSVKEQILSKKGNSVDLIVNRGRKKFEDLSGVIENTYPSVFTIKGADKTQTFSYFDVLCGTVVFKKPEIDNKNS